MSETVHYKGKLRLVEVPEHLNMTLEEYAEKLVKDMGLKMESYFNNIFECLEDCTYYGAEVKYYYHRDTKELYMYTREDVDPYNDIIEGERNKDGTINYTARFYNGGCSLHECFDEIIKKL